VNFPIRDLSRKEIEEIPLKLTLEQLNYYGFVYSLPEDEPEQCPFCKKTLILLGRRSALRNTVFAWDSICDCQEFKSHIVNLEENHKREEDERKALEEKEAFKKKVKRLFDQSKLGKRFMSRTFENFNVDQTNNKALRSVYKYAEKFNEYRDSGVGFMLSGPYGTGKTHLAGALTIDLINSGHSVIFGTLIKLLGVIRQSYSDNWTQDDEITIIDTYSKVDLLIIDDLGKERVSDWTLEKLFTIINQRYENYLPVGITTNYTKESLIKRLTVNGNSDVAESIVSRLTEMCKGIYLGGNDRRNL
jgi:DNA replication protein DnaC